MRAIFVLKNGKQRRQFSQLLHLYLAATASLHHFGSLFSKARKLEAAPGMVLLPCRKILAARNFVLPPVPIDTVFRRFC